MRRYLIAICVWALLITVIEAHAEESKFSIAPDCGIPNEYIVVLWGGDAASAAKHLTELYGGEILSIWQYALQGFSVRIDERGARRMSEHYSVKLVSQNWREYCPIYPGWSPSCPPKP